MSAPTPGGRTIVAMGGGGFSMEPGNPLLDEYVLALAGKERPRVCFVPTASGDAEGYIQRFYEAFPEDRCLPAHLALFRRAVADLRSFVLEQDVLYVGGGNTASMLAVWRAHGLDSILREAWERGVILCGLSAGSLCWFEAGVTDSFGPGLASLRGLLGFLPGSNCPHYDGEPERRPAYRRLVAAGELPPGLAAEDGVAVRFAGTEVLEIVSSRPDARAFRVERDDGGAGFRETALPVSYLGRPPPGPRLEAAPEMVSEAAGKPMMEAFYGLLWPSLEENAERFSLLDEELPWPEGDPLLDVARERGLAPGKRVLDVGCGKGRQAAKLAKELGVSVVGLEPLARNAAMARRHLGTEGVLDRVRIVEGRAEAMPLQDGAVDLVWCRDTLNHVSDLRATARECARVLRPGGTMLNVSAVRAEGRGLDRGEAAAVARPLGVELGTLDREAVEAAFGAAGLEVVETGSTCREGSHFLEAVGPKEGRDVLRLARLLRGESRFVAALRGRGAYETLEAYYLWNAYLLIRKIEYRVWVLEKA